MRQRDVRKFWQGGCQELLTPRCQRFLTGGVRNF
jgi:hypothetical protein